MPESRVLLTDGAMKHTLAAVRALGVRGLKVTVVDESPLAESFYSKYCHGRRLVSRGTQPEEYVLELRNILEETPHDVLLPIGWRSNYTVAQYRHHLDGIVALALPDFESMKIAATKDLSMEFAERHGILVPKTIRLRVIDDLQRAAELIGYPLVIKGSTEGGKVVYARDFKDLQAAYDILHYDRPIAQQWIQGNGVGFFAAYSHGNCIAQFMHKRVREYPRSGGPSTAARVFYSSKLVRQGRALLDALNWHGVAMVEFKHSTTDGEFYLMEINPKFWGSLELSMHAGLDFAYIAYCIALDKASSVPRSIYRKDACFRWPFPGDFLCSLESRELLQFLKRFMDRRCADDIRLSDPIPLIMQLLSTLRKIKMRKGT